MCLRLDIQRVELGRPQSPGPANIRSELEPSRAYDVVQLFVKDVDELRRLGQEAVRASGCRRSAAPGARSRWAPT